MTEDANKPDGLVSPEGFFKGVKYFLIGNIEEKVKKLLSDGGGVEERYMSETITHAIADDCEADDYSEAKELFELTVVTSRWVLMSLKCGALLPTNGFMPEKDQLFSDVVVCCSGLTEIDARSMWGLVTYHGGSCQSRLDSNVTHLVCHKAIGVKYEAALAHKSIRIVCPDWITQCVKNKSKVAEDRYHPRLLNLTPPPTPPKPPTPEPPQLPPPQLTPKLEPKLEPGTLHMTIPLQHMSTTTHQQQHQQQQQQLQQQEHHQHHYGYPPHYASPYAVQAGLQALGSPPPRPPPPMMHHQQPPPPQQQMFPQMMMDQAAAAQGFGLKGESARTKEALARMVSNRLHGRAPGSPDGIRHPVPGSPGGNRPASPRAHLRNITNNEPKSPRSKMTQLVNSLSRPPRPMSPGRSALSAQLQQLAANRLAHTAAQQPEVPVFFGHDPIETVPEDLCLLGCVFFITDYQKYLSPQQISTWKKVIEQHGGQVDDSYSNRVTHLLCETQQSDVFVMAQRDHKRLVTAYWLNDVLIRKKMTPPWLALHYPSLYGTNKPCGNQIICITNFEGEERQRIKNMISVLGAKYTGYMTHSNSVLIAKRREGLKYRKALEWRIPVLNVQWLTDLMLGNLEALKLPPQSKYQQFGSEDDFKVELWRVGLLLDGWRTPLRIPKDAWKKFNPSELMRRSSLESHGIKRKASDSESMVESKRLRMDPPHALPPHSEGTPIVVMTGIPKVKAEQLAQAVRRLGGIVSDHPRHCTHLVTNSISRTVKFLCALSVTKYIVSSYWIEQSALENKFLDVNNFVLRDMKAEKQYSFSLEQSLRRAQEKPLFYGMRFHITPSVVPPFSIVQQIVESAGGIVIKKRPSVKAIKQYFNHQGEPTFVCITTEEDFHLNHDLIQRKFPLHNVELILTGVMQQRVDFKAYEIQPYTKMKPSETVLVTAGFM